jgi:hypothetical protein
VSRWTGICKKPRREFPPATPGIVWKFQKRTGKRGPSGQRGTKNHDVGGKRKKASGFFLEIRHAIPDRRIDHGFAAEGVRNGLTVSLEQKLIQAVVLIEQPQGGFKPLGQHVHRRSLQAFVIDPVHFQNDADVSRFREEDVRSQEAKEIDHGIERSHLFVVLENASEIQHGFPRTTETGVNFAGSYSRRSFAA